MKTPKSTNIACVCIGLFGCSAMLGELLSNKALKGIGLASQLAPFTKVFGLAHSYEDQLPFETFASGFTLHYTAPDGTNSFTKLTPEVYSQLNGPYNRRNVYGALLAYGPALPPELRANGLEQALTSENAITCELGIPKGSTNFHLSIQPRNPQLTKSNFTLVP